MKLSVLFDRFRDAVGETSLLLSIVLLLLVYFYFRCCARVRCTLSSTSYGGGACGPSLTKPLRQRGWNSLFLSEHPLFWRTVANLGDVFADSA